MSLLVVFALVKPLFWLFRSLPCLHHVLASSPPAGRTDATYQRGTIDKKKIKIIEHTELLHCSTVRKVHLADHNY